MATTTQETFAITRTTNTIPRPFNEVIARLEYSIKHNGTFPGFTKEDLSSKEAFEATTRSYLGPHNFMHFDTFDHSIWPDLFDVGNGRGLRRIVFGNPLRAITMLRRDSRASLFVSVNALVMEREDGRGTDVIQIRPSTPIAGEKNADPELRAAAEVLDDKLDALWKWAADGECS